jgi:hypothetical protein
MASTPSRTVVQPIANIITASPRLAGFSPNQSERQLNNRAVAAHAKYGWAERLLGHGMPESRSILRRSTLISLGEGAAERTRTPLLTAFEAIRLAPATGLGSCARRFQNPNSGPRLTSRPNVTPEVAPGAPEATRNDHFFIFKSAPLKVLTMATMSPSWVS